MNKKQPSRRTFLRDTSLAVAAIAVSPISFPTKIKADTTAYKYPNPGKIVIAYHPNAVSGYNNADYNVVQQMFDQAIMQFTGITSSPAEALASLFPGLTTSKKIAVKPNIYNAAVPTRKELAKAVITRLVQMLGGFPATNITFYDRHGFGGPGYTTSYFGQPVKLVTDSTFPNLGYTIYCNGKDRPYSKSLHDADYLINMPVLKDMSCGTNFNFTLSFKNQLGTVIPDRPLGIHCDKKAMLDVMADNIMTTKQRLVITDCLFAIYNGGPSGAPQAMPKKIMISQDPVTSDYQGRKLINELRVANSLSTKAAAYIEEASKSPYEIGVADPTQMNVIQLQLTDADELSNTPTDWTLSDNLPNPFSHETKFILELQKVKHVDIRVYDVSGNEIQKLVSDHLSVGIHSIEWQARNYTPGIYLLKAIIGGMTTTRKMILIK